MPNERELDDGEVVMVQGSAAAPYEVKNSGGVYSCTCPAWRNQSRHIDLRTCKHIRAIRGEAAEAARVGASPPPAKKSSSSATAAPVLLAQKWETHVDISGWWLSEKLDGVRAYWTGTEMLSRLGNRFEVPAWFADVLGQQTLDGELWVGRREFQKTVGVVRSGQRSAEWKAIKYLIFDAPDHGGTFEERVGWLKENFADVADHIEVVLHIQARDFEHVKAELARVEALGGEGLMARQPGSRYVAGRSSTLLKIKSFLDDEALVVGHVAGAGRHKGRLGSLEAELRSGARFNVGTGFSDAERAAPPPLGAIINVRYQELTPAGVPRFPSYVGVRYDIEWTGATPPAKVAKAKTAAKKAAPAALATPSSPAAAGARRFEFSDGKSHKFWEISVEGSSFTVRYGRIGAAGTAKTKAAASASAAAAAAEKLIAEKTGKGYEEI